MLTKRLRDGDRRVSHARKPRSAGRARTDYGPVDRAGVSSPLEAAPAAYPGDRLCTSRVFDSRLVSIRSLATRSSQNMRASSRAASTANRRSSANSEAKSRPRSASQAASTRSTMRRLRRAAPPRSPIRRAVAHGRDRFAERRIGLIRQPGLAVESAEAGNIPVVDIAGDAVDRHVGQFRQRFLEQHHIAGKQRAQDHAGGQLAALAQMLHQIGRLPRRAYRRRARRSPSRRPRAWRLRRVRDRAIAAR